jgi:hypothetical protein
MQRLNKNSVHAIGAVSLHVDGAPARNKPTTMLDVKQL